MILITSDLHLSVSPRDSYRDDFMKALPGLAKKQGADLILILGDLCESKDEHPSELVNSVVDHFHALAQVAPLVVLKGNHDYLHPDHPYFGFLGRLKGVSWVGQPTALNSLQNVPEAISRALGRGAILLPHSANPDRDWRDLDFRKYDWAFTHQTFAGATSDSGFKLSGVSLSLFPKHMQIVSGDIHHPQQLGNLTYCGSPFRIDFGDDFEPRILLIDDKGKIKSLPVDGPQKFLIEVKTIGELQKQAHLQPGDILKVRLTIRPDQHADWPALVSQVKAWGAEKGYLIDAVQPIIMGGQKSMTKSKPLAPKQSDEQLLAEYAKVRGVDDKTVKVGLGLL